MVQDQVTELAKQAKKPFKAFAKELEKSGRLRGLHHNLLLSKSIDFLLEGAKFEIITEPTEESNE